MSADSPDPNDLPPATREALDSLGGALGDLAELDEEQLAETTALLKTLGHDEAADLLANRRDVLKTLGAVGAGGLVGAAGVSSATGRAEAGTNQAGTIGTPSNPVDVEAEDVNAAMVDADAVHTDKVDTGGIIVLDGTEDIGAVMADNPNAVIDLNGHTFEFQTFERPEPVTLINGTLRQADGANISAFFNDGKAIDGMRLENVTFDGNIANNTTKPEALQFTSGKVSNLTVRDCEFIECEFTIYANAGAENILVENSRFQDCTKGVIANGDIHGFTVRSNVLAGSGEDGFITTDVQGPNEEIRYIDNQLDEADPFQPTRYTYRVNNGTIVRIRGNVADSAAAYYDTSSTGGSGDNISITNSEDVIVSENHVRRSGDMCLTVENSNDIRVFGNVCENADAWGISYLNNTNGTVCGNICKNNAQDYSGRGLAVYTGISVNDSTDITLGRNRSFDDQGTPTQEYGMAPYRGTTDWVIVTDNILRGNGTGAINGTPPTNSVESDNLI